MLFLTLSLLCILAATFFYGAFAGNMGGFLVNLYEAGCAIVPWLAVLLLARRRDIRRKVRLMEGTRWIWMAIFVAYIVVVFSVTGAGTLEDAVGNGLNVSGGAINLLPFSQGISAVGYVLNVALCVPLGFLLPLLWERLDGPVWALAGGLFFSLLIELSQLLNFRATDVDDLVMNTLGAFLGWGLFRLFARAAHWKRETVLQWPLGPVSTVAVLFLGRFLFCYESVLARFAYLGV